MKQLIIFLVCVVSIGCARSTRSAQDAAIDATPDSALDGSVADGSEVDGASSDGAVDEDGALVDGSMPNDASGNDAGTTVPGPLGATLSPSGTTFRVWAPNADAVHVAGTWNSFSPSSDPLVAEGNGIWATTVADAHAGHEYRYVIQHGTDVVERSDPRAGDMTSSSGPSVIHDPNAYAWQTTSFSTPPWNEQVLYEMHIGTFNDAPGGAPGTWSSAIAKLDHLASLGINMVEVMPVAEFSGDYSWGYNGADLFAPESIYGTPDDMKHFVDEAHARGIGVILDVVHNHWGPQDLSTWCFDGECYGKGGIYFYTDDRHDTGWGPRPDFGRMEVRDFIIDNTAMWLNEYRIDGMRWDSTVNMRRNGANNIPEGWTLLQEINDAVDQSQPWKIMIAEDLQGWDVISRPTAQGGAGFDSQWDGGFVHGVRPALLAANDSERNVDAVRDAVVNAYNGQATQRVIFTENHDEVANGRQRIPEMIWPGNADSYWCRKRSTLGAAIALSSPGIPMLFQGQELLEDGYFTDMDPIDWSRATTYGGILAMYRDLVRMRRNLDGTTRGLMGNNVNVFHVNNTDKVLAYHRWLDGGAGDDVIILANFSNVAFTAYDIGLPRAGTWHVRFNGDATVYGSDFNNTASPDVVAVAGPRDGLGYRGSVGVGPYSVVILSQ